ncbi:MAG: hypothetical protein ACI8X5_001073 [Planctomycetota bacterium]|jgi:hypothetical protein
MNLSPAEIIELIASGEGRCTEFKRGLPQDERIARTLCAFANTRGGILLVGVNDNGSLYGVPKPKEVMADLRRVAEDCLEPPLRIETTVVDFEGMAIVAAQVAVSIDRPHMVLHENQADEIVVRLGSSNRVAQGAVLDALRNGSSRARPRGSLEATILTWVEERALQSEAPGGDATPALFSRTKNIGVQRAMRAFVKLERDGLLVGHGEGRQRLYSLGIRG